MRFLEYFSSPGELTLDTRRGESAQGAWIFNRTVFFLDGRLLHWDYGLPMQPGRNMFSYNSRSVPKYRSTTLQEPPTIGKLVKQEDTDQGKEITVRRLLTKSSISWYYIP